MTPALICSDCRKPLKPNPRRKGTRCKPCSARAIATSPAHREAASRAMSRRWANPNEAFALGRAISAGIGPEERERRRARGMICCNARAAAAGTEARLKAGRSLSRTRLGWLPMYYRDEYFNLRNNHKYSAAEARKIIEAQMSRDLERYSATGKLQQSPRLQAAAAEIEQSHKRAAEDAAGQGSK
ncbi:MAG: hypothetical protein WC803_08870 [Sphingomonas sp.]|jgi:hypothetical protein